MSEWYYAQNTEQKGPVNEAEIKELLATKVIPPDALVWKEGMGEWTPANKLPEFVMRTPPRPAGAAGSPAPAPAATAAPAPSPVAASASPLPERELAGTSASNSGGGVLPGEPLYGFLYKPQVFTPDPQDVEKNKIFAILSLFPLLFWLPMVAAKDSAFAKFYGNQGLTLLVISLVVHLITFGIFIGISVLGAVFAPLALLACPLQLASCAFTIGFLVVMVMGMLKANSGKVEPLPYVGGYVLLK